MHQAAWLQFERVMCEFAQWRNVPPRERSPAPAWWWGAAIAVLDVEEPMQTGWCRSLGLRADSGLAEGAKIILALFAEQTSVPGPSDFPRKTDDHAVRDLHPQPSDDSAFQP